MNGMIAFQVHAQTQYTTDYMNNTEFHVYIYIHIFMYMYNCLNIPRYPRVGEYISGQVLIYYLFLIWLGSGVYFTMTCMSQGVLLYMSLSSMSMPMFSESYIQYPYVAFPLSVFRHMSIFFLNGTSF